MTEYYSLYQDKRTLERIPIIDGVPDFNQIQKVCDIYGFHDRYVLDGASNIPSINRCHLLGIPEPNVFCQGHEPVNGEIQIGLNSGVIQKGGNAIRFYLPPSTVALGLNIHFQNDRGEVPILYRVGIAPKDMGREILGYVPLVPGETKLITVPATANFIKLSDIKNEQPPSEIGHWVYIKFPTFSEHEAMVNVAFIQVRVLVDLGIFREWFEIVKWDEHGDPMEGNSDPIPIPIPIPPVEASYEDDILYIPEVRVGENYFHDVTVEVGKILSFEAGRK